MQQIENLFDQLDYWRHFPNYQLARRADIFFSLYMQEVLEAKLGFAVAPELVPEFPVRIGTLNECDSDNDKSYKIDYLAVATAGEKSLLVELKTEKQQLDVTNRNTGYQCLRPTFKITVIA